jgi:hypothetical protein
LVWRSFKKGSWTTLLPIRKTFQIDPQPFATPLRPGYDPDARAIAARGDWRIRVNSEINSVSALLNVFSPA